MAVVIKKKNEVSSVWSTRRKECFLADVGECLLSPRPRPVPLCVTFLLNDTSAVVAVLLGHHYPTGVCGSNAQMCVRLCVWSGWCDACL